jgi:class 3 adenylate cyclase
LSARQPKAIELGDRRWREVLDAHDRITDREVTDHGGRLIKTTGDGMLATFDGPVRAIQCAHAVRSALLDLGVAVRAGVHAGEVERRGADIGAVAVHMCHRIQGKAAVGEILVSSDVPPLVAGSGITFTEAGTHQLKGFPGSWRLLSATPG